MIDIAGLRATISTFDRMSSSQSKELLDAYEAQAERIAALEADQIKRGGFVHDCHEFIRAQGLWEAFCKWLPLRKVTHDPSQGG